MIKVAISGAGAIAERAHIPALRSVPAFEIVAIQSRTEDKARALADRLWTGAASRPHTYSDYDRMLASERPEAVCIFNPNHLHCDFSLKAIAAGAHVLCEKPLAPTVAQAQRMVDAAERAKRVMVVAMQRRHGGLETAVKRAITSGAIGKPLYIRARLAHAGPESWAPGQKWFTTASEAGGGAALDLGVHIADLAIFLLGEVDSVTGRVANLAGGREVDDTAIAILGFKSGAMGVLEPSWAARPMLSAMEIYGTGGRIMLGYPGQDVAILGIDGKPAPGFSREEIMSGYNPRDLLAPFRLLAQNFADAIEGRAAPNPDGRDGLRAVEVIEACYRSSRSGATVRLPLS